MYVIASDVCCAVAHTIHLVHCHGACGMAAIPFGFDVLACSALYGVSQESMAFPSGMQWLAMPKWIFVHILRALHMLSSHASHVCKLV